MFATARYRVAQAQRLARPLALVALPLALLLGYLFWAFLPSREQLAGFGDDPAFNAWHFLHLFRSFDRAGPWTLFSKEVWNAPIFAPGELHLGLSENQLWPALLLWPLWKLSGGLVFTLGVGMVALHLAAFGAAAGWLGALGVRELRFWGGLVFALSGWLQDHYAHWQNGCIFLLPLALWAWARFCETPSGKRLVLCALAFGWIVGWNLYFAVMMGTLFAALLAHALLTKRAPRARLVLLAALAVLVQLPILWRYAQLAAQVGQFAAWDSYPAGAWSWLGRFARPSLLEHTFRAWPRAHPATIEAAGFVGLAWAGLSLLSVIRARARWPLVFAACAFWISLGFGHGALDVLALAPPFNALRAIGRFQIGVMLGTLPAVFLLLEEWRGVRRILPLALVLLELWPAGPALRVHIPRELDGPPTPIEAALSSSPEPVLVVDDAQRDAAAGDSALGRAHLRGLHGSPIADRRSALRAGRAPPRAARRSARPDAGDAGARHRLAHPRGAPVAPAPAARLLPRAGRPGLSLRHDRSGAARAAGAVRRRPGGAHGPHARRGRGTLLRPARGPPRLRAARGLPRLPREPVAALHARARHRHRGPQLQRHPLSRRRAGLSQGGPRRVERVACVDAPDVVRADPCRPQ